MLTKAKTASKSKANQQRYANMKNEIRTEESAVYNAVKPSIDHSLINAALCELKSALRNPDCPEFTSPQTVKDFLKLTLAAEEREKFLVLVMDNRHRLIESVELFAGTVNAAAVYPREIVKAALRLNGAAVILAHNHPSGVAEPSQADRRITDRIKEALCYVEVTVLDHIVVGGDAEMNTVSFAERGWV